MTYPELIELKKPINEKRDALIEQIATLNKEANSLWSQLQEAEYGYIKSNRKFNYNEIVEVNIRHFGSEKEVWQKAAIDTAEFSFNGALRYSLRKVKKDGTPSSHRFNYNTYNEDQLRAIPK